MTSLDSLWSAAGRHRPAALGLIGLLLGAAVFASSLASIAVTREAGGVAAIWPADAIILVAVLLLPRRAEPVSLGTGLLGIALANIVFGDPPLLGVALAACNIAGVALAAALYRRTAAVDAEGRFAGFFSARNLLGFAVICGGLGPVVSAALAGILLWLARGVPFPAVWLGWFLSDALGILVIAPLLLSIRAADARVLLGKGRLRETLLLLTASAAVALLASAQSRFPVLFLLFPAVILPAFRLGFGGTALVCAVVSAVAITDTLFGRGPLAAVSLDAHARILWLQLFLAVMELTALPVAAALTARRLADERLLQSRSDLQSVIDNIPAMIAYWNKDLHNRFCNRAYIEWFGKSPDRIMLGMHIRDVIGERLYALNLPYIEAALRGERQSFEREITIPSGERRQTVAHYVPNFRDGGVDGFYVMVFDVSTLKRTEAALLRAKDAAESATRAKSKFLSRMSHELRTPMNSILGFTELLQTRHPGPLNERQAEYLGLVHFSATHLLHLIDDILELTRIEAGRLAIAEAPVAVVPLLRSVVSSLLPMAEKRGVEIREAPIARDLPDVLGDPTRAAEVLLNLGSNAIKYNRRGGHAEFSAERIPGGFVRFKVSDDGIGIPEDQQPGLFQEFNRLGAEQSGIEGTGIGLTLTKRLVELMHGTIGFTSAPGTGSTFWIDLPVADAKPRRG